MFQKIEINWTSFETMSRVDNTYTFGIHVRHEKGRGAQGRKARKGRGVQGMANKGRGA